MGLQVYINGVLTQSNVIFRNGDDIEVFYSFKCLGEPEFGDYMNFLHDCYKHEETNMEINYAGAWIK